MAILAEVEPLLLPGQHVRKNTITSASLKTKYKNPKMINIPAGSVDQCMVLGSFDHLVLYQ